MTVLEPAALNRALLARQLLLERADLPIPRALERMGFLQAQYAPSMYIGLWSRVTGFRREALTAALEDRSVVQGTLLRATIHLVSAEDWWPAAIAVREPRRQGFLAYHRKRPSALAEVEDAAGRTRELLAARGPTKRSALVAELGVDSAIWNGVGLWVDLVRVPPSGTWERRRADLYALADDWLGPPRSSVAVDDGLELLLRRYLGGFGPASLGDAATWAGVPAASLRGVADRLRLRRVVDDAGTDLVDLPEAPLPDAATEAPVRFLPVWDATLLVHARRTRILPEEHRSKVFSTKTPQSVATFLVDGQVAGTWRADRGGITTEPFTALAGAARAAVDAEAERLAELHR